MPKRSTLVVSFAFLCAIAAGAAPGDEYVFSAMIEIGGPGIRNATVSLGDAVLYDKGFKNGPGGDGELVFVDLYRRGNALFASCGDEERRIEDTSVFVLRVKIDGRTLALPMTDKGRTEYWYVSIHGPDGISVECRDEPMIFD